MNIEPEEFGGICGFENYPPNKSYGDEAIFSCNDPGGGGSDGGCID